MREDEPDILDMLIAHELAVKRLYEVFGTTFVDRRDLWQALATDEQEHADRLSRLRPDPRARGSLVRESRLRPEAVKSSISYVESQIERAEGGRLALLQALSIARDLESALIEEELSKLCESEHPEIRSIMMGIAEETKGHREMLNDALHGERRRRL